MKHWSGLVYLAAGIAVGVLVCWGRPGSHEQGASVEPPARAVVEDAAVSEPAEHPLPPKRLPEPYVQTEVVESAGGMRDVYVYGRNVTQFSRPQHIYTAEASPDGRYLLVWHLDYPPRKLSIYELDAETKLATFVPGAGGSIGWAAHNLIYHQYGAGTNTALFKVYSVSGETVWTGAGTGASLDESGQYVLTFPSLPVTEEKIVVADVRDGSVLGSTRPSDVANVIDYSWLDALSMRFWYVNTEGETKTVDVDLVSHELAEPRDAGRAEQ